MHLFRINDLKQLKQTMIFLRIPGVDRWYVNCIYRCHLHKPFVWKVRGFLKHKALGLYHGAIFYNRRKNSQIIYLFCRSIYISLQKARLLNFLVSFTMNIKPNVSVVMNINALLIDI